MDSWNKYRSFSVAGGKSGSCASLIPGRFLRYGGSIVGQRLSVLIVR